MGQGHGVRVQGLSDTMRRLTRLGVDAEDLKGAMQRVGAKAANDARADIPTRTGALVSSLRQNKAKNKAVLRLGTARTYYASFIEFGTGKIEAVHMLTRAAESNASYMVAQLEREIEGLINKYDLN